MQLQMSNMYLLNDKIGLSADSN